MKDIKTVISGLQHLINDVPGRIRQFSQEKINHKPNPDKWCKKEILGHLCDSALNNIQRLIRVQYEHKPFITYNQDDWVKRQNYREQNSEVVLELWISLHRQFVLMLKSFPESKLGSIVDIGKEVTARFVITDYLDHQLHHFRQIFEDWDRIS